MPRVADELAEEAGALPAALDTLAEALRGRLASAGDLLLTGVLDDLLTRAHRTLLKNTYDRVHETTPTNIF